ncbi:hypothetical protein ETU09_03285 [Apibacter muscae]|uniref:Uncharacterized protein n=1 Tax=Apibacter muscae TaxID=2509004 RepID=A0A563DG43_9FLAO|nr:hypothetical protein [Apibacter muscae]TWP29256.1 hypothetical protein ETU09_03285 [Apibacter muscae]
MSRKEVDRFSLQFNNPEKLHIYEAQLSKETLEALGFNKKAKAPMDYFAEFIGSKKELDKIIVLFNELTHKSITEEQKKKCSKCGVNPPDPTANPICEVLGKEGNINFFLASKEFIEFVLWNKKIFTDKEQIKRLTRSFFSCFRFYQGHVYFELRELGLKCLKEGLISISSILSKSSVFERFKIMNTSLHSLRNELLYYKLEYDRENEFLKKHIEWYEDQERFYSREWELEKEFASEPPVNEAVNSERNPYPHIFKDLQAFNLFEGLLEVFEVQGSDSQMADLTDIYILLLRDQLIYESFKPSDYLRWLHENYIFISLDRLHPISTRKVSVKKRKIYTTLKPSFYKTM